MGNQICKKQTLVALLLLWACFFGADVFLTALVQIATDLSLRSQHIQITMSSYLLGLSLGQLLYIAVLSRLGLMRLLILSFALFIAASIACALADSLSELALFRFLQGSGIASSIILSRCVLDAGSMSADAQNDVPRLLYLLLVPLAVAPVIGAYITVNYDWRYVFIFSGIIVTGLLLLVAKPIHQLNLNNVPLVKYSLGQFIHSSIHLLAHRRFIGYLIVICSLFAAIYAYAVEAPFVFHRAGLSLITTGLTYVAMAGGFIVSAFLYHRLQYLMKSNRVLIMGCVLFLLGPLFLSILAMYREISALEVILCMAIMTSGHGIIMTACYIRAVNTVPQYRLTAARLISFFVPLVAAFAVSVVGPLSVGHIFPLALLLIIAALVNLLGLMSMALIPE